MHPNLFPSTESSDRPVLDTKLHVKYWQRCLKSLLPTQYQSNDSSRLLLAFLNLAALDALGVGASTFPKAQRDELKGWLLKCQHPNGGFCGSPNHKYPAKYYQGGRNIDPAGLPATFFGILSLAYVGGLEELDREATLRWLTTVQREDGSFGELVEENGHIAGGRDMRYCHFGSGTRRLLRGDLLAQEDPTFKDIDVDGLVRYIRAGETYDGGIAESTMHEPHAGYTYCGIAALSFMDRLFDNENSSKSITGLTDPSATIKWLMSRQVAYEAPDSEDGSDSEAESESSPPATNSQAEESSRSLANLSINEAEQDVGCNGRCNKAVDTCYCFWVGASLKMMGHGSLVNQEGYRRFLINRTQHRIGGFGKCPGYPPDMYHSYLGLVALSLMDEPGLKPIDPAFCVSYDAKKALETYNVSITNKEKAYYKNGLLWKVAKEEV